MVTKPTVLVVQHVAAEPPSAVGTAIEHAGSRMELVRVHAGEPVPESLGRHAGLVVMGGPMGVYEADRYPHLGHELRLIEQALAQNLPMLGICLGSQLLAAALGASVRPGPSQEIGWHPVSLEPAAFEDALFNQVPPSFTPLHWHGDIYDLPRGAVALARSQRTTVQAFRWGGSAYGILFHLEVTSQQLSGMVDAFADELGQAGVSAPEMLQGWGSHGSRLEDLARVVFAGWMDLVGGAKRVPPST